MKRFEPTVSNPPVPVSDGNSATLISTPSNSRSVFLYSRRFSRRIVISPSWSDNSLRAATIAWASSSSRSALATSSGCGLSSGGISPEFITLSTFCQRSAVTRSSISKGRSSSRTLPFCTSLSWQSRQCFSSNTRCRSPMTARSFASSPRTNGDRETNAKTKRNRKCMRSKVGRVSLN